MKRKRWLSLIPCLLVGTGVFFLVNHRARAQAIVAVAGELPYIPGCPLHEYCVKALQEERMAGMPRFPAGVPGGVAGLGSAALVGGAFLAFSRRPVKVVLSS
ncbi:MAG: hypothetical protein LBQ30_00790 [Treponema sp.]|jgi:hypothetical protein|nr:hypothetical protein [Treponema sp.]